MFQLGHMIQSPWQPVKLPNPWLSKFHVFAILWTHHAASDFDFNCVSQVCSWHLEGSFHVVLDHFCIPSFPGPSSSWSDLEAKCQVLAGVLLPKNFTHQCESGKCFPT